MTIDRDPLDILSALAPPPADPALLARAHARTTTLRAAPPRRRWTTRSPVVLTLALALSAGGVGLATADDPVPSQVLEAASHWESPWKDATADPRDAVRVGSTPYADGVDFSVWAAQSPRGNTCYVTVLEPTSGGGWPTTTLGSWSGCESPFPLPAPAHPVPFALQSVTSVEGGTTSFTAVVGETARATLTLPDGSVHELLAAVDTYFGWLPVGTSSGVVTAYLPDGTVADTVTVHGS